MLLLFRFCSARACFFMFPRSLFFFPATGCYCCLGSVPRGLRCTVNQATLPRDVSTALRLLNMTENKYCVMKNNFYPCFLSGRPPVARCLSLKTKRFFHASSFEQSIMHTTRALSFLCEMFHRCHSERSRGISWKRMRKSILPALLSPKLRGVLQFYSILLASPKLRGSWRA